MTTIVRREPWFMVVRSVAGCLAKVQELTILINLIQQCAWHKKILRDHFLMHLRCYRHCLRHYIVKLSIHTYFNVSFPFFWLRNLKSALRGFLLIRMFIWTQGWTGKTLVAKGQGSRILWPHCLCHRSVIITIITITFYINVLLDDMIKSWQLISQMLVVRCTVTS